MVPNNWPRIAQRLPVEKYAKICKVSPYRTVERTVQARHQHSIWFPIDGHRQVSLCFSMISKKTGQRCCYRDRFGDFSFGETVISKKKSSPTRRYHIILVFWKIMRCSASCVCFRLFFLRKYASDGTTSISHTVS